MGQIYDNKQIAQYTNEMLDTYLSVEAFAEVDDTLVANPGEEVEIFRYSDTGAAQKVAENAGNTTYSDIDGTSYKFKIITTQDRTKITDEEAQRNPYVASNKITMIAKHIINALRGDVVAQWYATSNVEVVASATGLPTVSELILAQSDLDLGVDNGLNGQSERVCFFLNPKDYRRFQSYLVGENVIIASEIINGKRYATVAGIPFDASDLIIEGSPVMATDKAVRILRAKCVDTESERDSNIRTTVYYNRMNNCVGLEFEKKALVFGTTVTATAGTATNGTVALVSPATTVANAGVLFTCTPDAGYKVGVVSAVDGASNPVPVTVVDEEKYLYRVQAPATGVTVSSTFVAI